jgi:hypothetical protein
MGGTLALADQLVQLARSSALNRTTYFLTAIFFPPTNHLHRCLAATEIQNLPSFSMTGANRFARGIFEDVKPNPVERPSGCGLRGQRRAEL